ncbi:beta-aspartyl-peptidase [Alteromonas halophila]|uniref:Isoaspartyl dipeptidase n=1 Tax=Alteromonas halophila TaxID=516698 RepID=A0A918JG37_9ALTE|nr:beta-aspartyl-peptidase [Alteromonas halophila]GGW79203.1 isoaspartyl dipeptidase [Alteromonas halophila]
MITLITNVDVYAPRALGVCDILIAGNRIMAIEPGITLSGEHITRLDGNGMIAMPGLVDSLVHITGGGGEGGFHTRTPEMNLTDATLHGVTTVIGALGTDATTRTLPELIAKAYGLRNEGISAYCYTGSYHYPVRTVTGDITDDIMLTGPVIGVGEVAIADHRSSQLSASELARIASQARVGGMLSGKGGIVSIHTGESPYQLSLLHEVTDSSDIPASQFYPTHINRSQSLMEAGKRWCERGGRIDVTTSTNAQFIAEGEIPAAESIAWFLGQGVDVHQLTMSSDGNASLPVFDNNGRLTGLEVGKVGSLYQSFRDLAAIRDVSLSDAIASVTLSPADILGLHNKGRLQPNADADIVLIDPATRDIQHVFANGVQMVDNQQARVKGTFEA